MIAEIFSALESSEPLKLPLVGAAVAAGFPSPGEDHLDKTLDLNELLIAHPAATFFVRVAGNSMEGAGIFPGDILVVDRSLEAKNGTIIVAVIDGEFTVKRLMRTENEVSLHAENPAYSPIQIERETAFQVWGVVTYVIHALLPRRL